MFKWSSSLNRFTHLIAISIFVMAGLPMLTNSATASAAPASSGPVLISLAAYFNNHGIGKGAGQANFDGASYAYPTDQVPAGGQVTLKGVPYQFPDSSTGANDNIVALGQNVTVTQGQYQQVTLLAAASFGTANGTMNVHYADGSTSSATLTVPDWYTGPADAVNTTYRYTPNGTDQHPVYIYAVHLALNVTKTLTSLTLPTTTQVGANQTSMHIFALTLLTSSTQNFYVATNGNDSNAGTIQAPFATLAKAKSVVQQALSSATGPINVLVRGGTYYQRQTLTFGPQDSGTATSPVTYSAYPGETVILSGGQLLQPSWSTYSGSIMVTTVGNNLSFDQLFMNGQRQILARYPNYDPNTAILNGYASDALSPQRVARWHNPTTGLVRTLHCNLWGGESYKITGVTNGQANLQWVGDNNRGNCMSSTYIMVENIFEELDAPGEWFYDQPNGKLYFYPPAGTNLASATFETASLDELIHIEGPSSQNPVRYLNFRGFTFTETHRTLFDQPYEGLQLGDWAVARAGTIHIKNAENITVQNSSFNQVGGNGIFVDGYNSNDLITQNQFSGSGASDIQVVGSSAAVRDHSTWSNMVTVLTDTTPGPKTNDYPRDITISYNQMYNMGRFEKQSAGVNISMSHHIVVSHNTIHHSPRSCLNINDGTWGGHVIEYNDIFDCVLETGDHGPINTWGRDRFWPLSGGDALQKQYAQLDVIDPIILRYNRIWHNSSWDIDLDDGSGNYQIYGNLLLNAGIKLRDGFSRTVKDNILVNGSIYEQVSHANDGDVVENNIILSSTPYQNVNSDPSVAKYLIDYNLFWNNGNSVGLPGGWSGYGLDTHSQTADPQFVNGSPWNNPSMTDYTVSSSSPALGLGFTNFAMNQFGDPGSPTPPPVNLSGGSSGGLTSVDQQPEPLMGATVTSIYSDAIMSSVGLGDHNGIYFQNVPGGSYAQGQGFQTADVIRSINGQTVTNRTSFWTAYNTIAPRSQINVSVWRSQAAINLTFTKLSGSEILNDTAGVVYTGSGWDWKNAPRGGSGSSQNDIYSTTTLGDSFSLTFNGSGIDMSTEINSDEGQIDIYIDNVYQKTIDCSNASRIYQQTVYSNTGLSAGQHTLKGVMKSGQYMIVDSFNVHS